jgi:tight adherence protein C
MIWLILGMVFTAFFSMAYGTAIVWNRRTRVKGRVGHPGPVAGAVLLRRPEQPSAFKGWILQGLSYPGQWIMPDLEKVSAMRQDLIRAGIRHPQAPAIYLGLRIVTAFAFTLPFILVLIIKGLLNPATLAMAFCPAIFGFYLPDKALAVKIRHRQERLDRALPDILDLFVICMEAGLSLNSTLSRVAEEIRGVYQDFCEELQITAGELRAGLPWDEAFDNLGKRTDVQSIRSMVGLMIQSNKLGASLAGALRHHSDFIRTQRVLRAEEKAAKLPVKMVFPLIFGIFPAIIIVTAGPGIIQIIDVFFKGGLFQGARPMMHF